jgi:hypothetical protein
MYSAIAKSRRRGTGNQLIIIIICVAVIALAVLAPTAGSHTHVENDGTVVSWYPKECCGDGDCRPVASIVQSPNGLWMTTVDGQTILVGEADNRLPSKDMRWHICVGTEAVTGLPKIRCIFEPSNASIQLRPRPL